MNLFTSLYMLDYEPLRLPNRFRSKFLKALEDDVACGQDIVQTNKVKFLYLHQVYDKFHRPNVYNVGVTYTQDIADYRFTCKIEHVGSIFLLHLFVSNLTTDSFIIQVPRSSIISIQEDVNVLVLDEVLEYITFEKVPKFSHNYLSSYSFTDHDVKYLQNKKIYIALSFSFEYNELISYKEINLIKLNYDLGKLMTDPYDSDFTIVSAEGTRYNVHKVILALHSPVFKAMLGEKTAETINGCVELVDVRDEDLQLMLEFLYTGTLKNLSMSLTRFYLLPDSPASSSIIEDLDCIRFVNLLILADRYDIQGLWEFSEYVISEQIEMFTVLEILHIGDLFGSYLLKVAAMNFIKSNKSIIDSVPFKEIKNPNLLKQLCLFLNL